MVIATLLICDASGSTHFKGAVVAALRVHEQWHSTFALGM
jgi:hypothetical protein